jgi:flagellar basal body-associated protein FliL
VASFLIIMKDEDCEMNSSVRKKAKSLVAVLGAGAVVALGALSVVVAQHSESQDTAAGTMQQDAPTTTTTTPVYAVQGLVSAKPVLTGSVHEQPGENPNRIP